MWGDTLDAHLTLWRKKMNSETRTEGAREQVQGLEPWGLIYFRACVHEIYWQKNFKSKKTLVVSPECSENRPSTAKRPRMVKRTNSVNNSHTIGLISCTKTVLVASPCHPLLPLALTRNRAPGSTTLVSDQSSKFATSRFPVSTHTSEKPSHHGGQG